MVKGNKTYMKFLNDYESELAKKVKKEGKTITVSGPSKVGKSTIAKSIANAFNLKYVFAGDVFRRVAKKRGMSLDVFSKTRENEIDYEVDKRNLRYAMKGKIVIDARLSGWVAGDWADVKVFVKCSIDSRARRLAKSDNMPLEKAVEAIKKRDKADTKRYKQLYGIEQFDTSIYDIVIDNSNLTINEAKTIPVKLVREFLRKRRK
jgi:cytidylate kinase